MPFVKGYKMSEEHKKKIGEANKISLKGRRLSENARNAYLMKYTGVPRPDYISKMVTENNIKTKSYLNMQTDKALLNKVLNMPRGQNHYNWKGGKAGEVYLKCFNFTLKEAIRKRDDFRCQECKTEEKFFKQRLVVHHKDENKKNNVSDNLISLCRSCHMTIHKRLRDSKNFSVQE